MFLPNGIRVDVGRIVFLVWIVKDKETIGNLNGLTRDTVGLADVLDLFLIWGIARIAGDIICQWLSFVLFFLTCQSCLCCCNLLRREVLFIEIMGMVAMSDHVTVLVLTDDHVCMETMIVLLFVLVIMTVPMFMLVTISMFMLVLMVNWFCTWTWRPVWTYFSRCSSTLGPKQLELPCQLTF